MVFKLLAEVAYRAGYWPGGGITERANGSPFNIFRDVDEQIDVVHVSMSMLDAVQHFFHPSRSFTAWAALSTRLMMVESRKRPEISYNACGLIHDNETART